MSTDYRNPEPLFFGPPRIVEDHDLEKLQAECAQRGHRPIFTVEKGWHCRECGAVTE